MTDLFLSEESLVRHTLVIGATGAGKTNFMQLMLKQQLLRGGGVLIIDGKDSKNELQSFLTLAEQHHRWPDVRLLHLGNAACSHTYNPLLRGDADELTARVLGFARDIKPDSDIARGLRTVLGLLHTLHLPFDFADLATLLSNGSALQWLQGQASSSTQEYQDFRMLLSSLIRSDSNPPQVDNTKLKQMFGSLSSRLFALSTGVAGKIFNTYSPTLDLRQAVQENQLVYAVLPLLSKRELAVDGARLLLADLASVVGRVQNEDMKPAPPFLVLLEGFTNYASPVMAGLFEQARSANVALMAFVETLGSLADTSQGLNQDFAAKIIGNTWHKMAFTTQDPTSCEQLSALAAQSAPGTGRYYLPETFRALPTGAAVLIGPNRVNYVETPHLQFVKAGGEPDFPALANPARRGLALASKFRTLGAE